MTKTNKEKVIKKVRKELVFTKQEFKKQLKDIKQARQTIHSRSLPKITLTPINNTTEIKEEKNHAITLIIVWLAILTVLAIYVSIK